MILRPERLFLAMVSRECTNSVDIGNIWSALISLSWQNMNPAPPSSLPDHYQLPYPRLAAFSPTLPTLQMHTLVVTPIQYFWGTLRKHFYGRIWRHIQLFITFLVQSYFLEYFPTVLVPPGRSHTLFCLYPSPAARVVSCLMQNVGTCVGNSPFGLQSVHRWSSTDEDVLSTPV